ncbi:unnamed protein product [Moneuplotes crassus]|uniref:Mitochondrial carrier protein n=1 Tax=Euplotes crassus TaxID=5936 RepID=A0AAD1XQ30_EUPCR|nr:unnamed protein product [Moneuplotes crassus]
MILNKPSPSPRFEVSKPARDFTAGVIAGISGGFVGHPLDTLRIRMQLSSSKSALELSTQICIKEGARGLFKGAMAPIIGRAPISGVTMTANDYCLRNIGHFNISDNIKGIVSGVFAGIISSPICCPIEHIKIRKQAYMNSNISYYSIVKADGISGLFRGLVPTLAREIPGYAMFFASYGYFKRLFKTDEMHPNGQSLKNLYILISGGLAGQLSWIACHPMDVVKSTMQNNPENTKMMSTFSQLMSKHGYKIFFKGMGPCLIRAFPVHSITFLLYEKLKNAFEQIGNTTNCQLLV